MKYSECDVKSINSYEDYSHEFNDDCIVKEALAKSLDLRKFEIELYWKRTTYFWSLIAICFTGYFALVGKDPSSSFLISSIGLTLSFGWVLANKGSKYWQNNWESHVDHLQCREIGPLYRTILAYPQKNSLLTTKAYPYSVSRINQSISIIISITWLFIFFDSFLNGINNVNNTFSLVKYWLFLFVSIGFLLFLYKYSLPKRIQYKKTKFIKILFEHEKKQ